MFTDTLRRFNYSSLMKQMVEIQNENFSWMQTSWFLDLKLKKKCVFCVHTCMGGIRVHTCSCVSPYVQLHGDSNINAVYFPQSLIKLIFEAEPFRSGNQSSLGTPMREYSHYINLGGLPHPPLVVKFWAELLDHQDGAEDNHPSLYFTPSDTM